ncbi:hypothetical protein TUM3794_03850 [Shewanella colwelliana]|uniref:Peptidase S9 prolyl oligopeptidase catalytic domain-containing protein n=1 Tax=Shewanella colwelliana TaxID=23 RepID=A0ABQ4NUS6_SHECO|nr:prolyl oligopeptidase family serine peptidase [Shewanella colwelliana]GIU35730.1 hypothetical protein TUM3794_03850 [Shewanella colwelliana]
MRALIALCLYCLAFYAQATPIPAKELFRSPAMSQVGFSPDNRYISALIVDEGKSYLSLIGVEDKIYQHVGAFDADEQLNEYVWIDNNTLYISYSHRGQARQVLALLSEKAGKIDAKMVTLPSDGYLVDPLIADPTHVLYAKNRYSNRPSNRLYKLTLDELINKKFNSAKFEEKKLKDVAVFAFDSIREELFAVTADIENMRGEVLYRSLNESRWKLLFEIDDSEVSFSPIGFIRDNTLAVLSNKNTDKVALYEFDIPSQTLGSVLYEHPKYDLVGAELDESGKAVKSVRYVENGHHVSHFFDNDINQIKSLFSSAFQGKETVISAHSNDAKQMLLFSYASDDPGSYYLFDVQSKKADLLTELYPDLIQHQLQPTEVFSVTNTAGVEVEAYLTLPDKQSGNGVLLVMPHGGPIGVRDFNYFNSEVQYFVSRGFAILRVNFRGSEGYGKQFLDSGKGEFGKAIEEDITAAVTQVRKQHKFNQMCAIGASYGGYSSLMLAIKHPDDYQCAVGGYGIYDLPLLFNANNFKVLEEYRESVSKVVGELSDELIKYSPVYLAEAIKSPVLLVAGKMDRIADFEHSMRMEYVLNKLGKEVETLYYEQTGHGQSSWYWQRHESAYVADYLKRTLVLDEYHQMQGVNDELVKQLGGDTVLIADGFHFDNRVKNDQSLALKYYRESANMGEGRAAYNLGNLLVEQGLELKENITIGAGVMAGVDDKENAQALINEGIKWGDKAVEFGYAGAGYWLGIVYELGELVEQDWGQSLKYFTAAAELEYDARARLRMAKAYCLAPAPIRDVQRCSELLSLSELEKLPTDEQKNTVTSKSYKTLRWVLGDIFAKGDYNQDERTLLKNVVQQEYQASDVKIDLDDVEFGEVTYNNYRNRYQVSDDAKSFVGRDKLSLGAVFNVEFEHEGENVALIGKWIKQGASGKQQVFDSSFVYGDADAKSWDIRYTFDEDELFKGTLTLEISDLNNKLLASKTVELR